MAHPANTKKKSVGLAMSGGVDSSVAAALLQEQGFAVSGFFLKLAQPDFDAQLARVARVAGHLGVPLTVIDLAQDFASRVLDYFAGCYQAGRTPNPCIICNPTIKFGRLLDEVMARGHDFLATGHYARIICDSEGIYRLLKGRDPLKDQSYFLCRLTQDRLARILLPHGEHTKEHVYELAAGLGLADKHGSESQDVCFLQDTPIGEFLAKRLEQVPPPGAIITLAGREVGRHNGIHAFTVGQRRGLGVPDATPYYVVAIDSLTNTVIVGKDKDLWKGSLAVRDINWLANQPPALPAAFTVKIRYRHSPAPALVESGDNGLLQVRFNKPQRAVTPGQFAVFYQGDEVVGSGEIIS